MATSHPPVLAVIGPTASGKTGLAIALAQRFNGEVISMDSALVYRGMDIGTAKPDLAERAGIAHHLIDVIDPTEAYSAARFRDDALRLVEEIRARGHLPIIAGGTMLYFKALREGLDDLPQADPALREEIEADATTRGWPALHADLAKLDPVTAQRLAPNDSQRVGRALEIIRLTGRPMSASLQKVPQPLPFPLLALSLEPSDRAVLHQRITHRFDAMLAAGLLDEVKHLRERYKLHPDLPSMRCVGYRQAWEFLDGTTSHTRMRELGIIATRQLAKRQLTWLRGMEGLTRLDCLRDDLRVAALLEAEKFLTEAT
jgi:tRNA dimethylallyltransferase